jgi:PAS domain S-box-containing protein
MRPAQTESQTPAEVIYGYERATRQVRWLILAIILVTFPPSTPHAVPVYVLLGVAGLYNLGRYIPAMQQSRFLSSRKTMIVVDTLFALTLIFLAGLGTAYSGLLALILIAATYWFGVRGLLSVLAMQLLGLVVVLANPAYETLELSTTRETAVGILVLFAIGYLVERLTHVERDERRVVERLKVENQAEHVRMEALVDSLKDATFVIDGKGRILNANGAAVELIGAPEDVRGRPISEFLAVEQGSHGHSDFFKLMQSSTEPQRRRDLSLKGSDGVKIDLDISITPVTLDSQNSRNYVVVCRDVTKEKSLEEQRAEFIAVASHELRTPLTILEGSLSNALIDKATLPKQTVELMEQAYSNALFLAGLVRELTTLSQAQNDTIPIELKPVNPRLLLESLVKDFAPQAAEKHLVIKADIRPHTPSVLSTEYHIREILQNYIGNAIKYSDEGRIDVRAEPSANGGVLLSVKDTGIGISATDQRQLFTKFYRSENFRTRKTGGTGLGLYLCLELAERLNAKVWCESVLNHGSTFFLEVPPFSQLHRDSGKVAEAKVATLIDQI